MDHKSYRKSFEWTSFLPQLPIVGMVVSILVLAWAISSHPELFNNFALATLIIATVLLNFFAGIFFAHRLNLFRKAHELIVNAFRSRDILGQHSLNNMITLQTGLNNLRIASQQHLDECSILISSTEIKPAYRDKKLIESKKTYHNAIKKTTQNLCSNILNQTKDVIEAYLKSKDIDLSVSLAIKRLDPPYILGTDINKVYITTTFRDFRTYNARKREIAKKKYSIGNNSDFLHLANIGEIRNSIYISNSLEDTTVRAQYANEHEGFLEFYDAAIVTSIADYSYPENKILYGYLTCDTKKTERYKGKEIFEREDIGEILLSTSISLAVYFREADELWAGLLNDPDISSTETATSFAKPILVGGKVNDSENA